jgi:predicted RNA polymerase sigma factor
VIGGLDEGALRGFVPRVLAGLVRRGEDFDAAEDALQEALLEALRVWPEHPPRDPRAWLATVATRRLVDARRSEAARNRREEATYDEPRPAATEEGDDTLFLLFLCCHPELTPASQVALTLRAVELAAYVSSEPGPGGEPLYEWIDVREVMWERARTTDAA